MGPSKIQPTYLYRTVDELRRAQARVSRHSHLVGELVRQRPDDPHFQAAMGDLEREQKAILVEVKRRGLP